MNFLKNSLTLAGKDLRILFKDRGQLAVLFLLPLLLGLVQGLPFISMKDPVKASGESKVTIKAYVVNQDQGPIGSQVVDVLEEIEFLKLTPLKSKDIVDQKVTDGDAPAAIIIPEDFSERINANKSTKVQLIKDPTHQGEAQAVAGILNDVLTELIIRAEIEYGIQAVYARAGILESADPGLRRAAQAQTMGAIWTAVQEIRQNPIISVQLENIAAEEVTVSARGFAFAYYMPMFATMFAFFMIGTMAESILKERTAGSFRRLMAAPMPPSTIIAGKMLGFIIVVFLQMLVLFGICSILFEMPLGNSPFALFMLTLALALSATSLGMLLGSLARSTKQAGSIGLVVGFLLLIASGLFSSSLSISPSGANISYPEEGFSYILAQLTPHAHALDGFKKIMIENAGLGDLIPNILALLGFSAVFFLVAIWRFKYD